jgi:hypothetical protein
MFSSAEVHDIFAAFHADAVASGTPTAYVHAVRAGALGSRHSVIVGETPARITIRAHSTGPRRDAASFAQLRDAMTAATTDGIQPDLPPEIGMVVWQHHGREIRICAPGTAPALRRARTRIRRRLTALSPLPLLGALVQPVAGSATAVGIAVAPIPPIHHWPAPPQPIVRDMTGEIDRPLPPWLPAVHVHAQPGPLTPPVLPPAEISSSDEATPPAAPPPRRRTRTTPPPPPATPAPAPTTTEAATVPPEPVGATPPVAPDPTPEATATGRPNQHAHPHKRNRKGRPPHRKWRQH